MSRSYYRWVIVEAGGLLGCVCGRRHVFAASLTPAPARAGM
jgi:hypothetical protein